jgi:hypothetical protein
MPFDADRVRGLARRPEGWAVGKVIKFPGEERVVRFGHDQAADKSATVVILPVVRIERYGDVCVDQLQPRTHPPSHNGGRRGVPRR